MIAAHVLGSWRTAGDVYARVGGGWRRVTAMAVHGGGSWRSVPGFVPPFSASAPTDTYGAGYSSSSFRPARAVSLPVTITPDGGTAPYSYAWVRISGDGRITASTPSMASTSFAATLLNEQAFATFQWTVTDANGATATGQVEVTLEASSGGDFA